MLAGKLHGGDRTLRVQAKKQRHNIYHPDRSFLINPTSCPLPGIDPHPFIPPDSQYSRSSLWNPPTATCLTFAAMLSSTATSFPRIESSPSSIEMFPRIDDSCLMRLQVVSTMVASQIVDGPHDSKRRIPEGESKAPKKTVMN